MKRLYRSKKHKVLGGVLGGIAEYFEIDPVLPRIIFLVLFLLVKQISWFMVVSYVVSCIILPYKSNYLSDEEEGSAREIATTSSPKDTQKILAWSLIIIGGIALMLMVLPSTFFTALNSFIGPTLLVLMGVLILIVSFSKSK